MSMGTIQYHLGALEKQGKIISEKHSLHRYYFPIGMFEENQKNILEILNQDTIREILLYIIEKKDPHQTDIANFVKISNPSVNWHIQRLLSLGIIGETREGKYKRYHFIGDPMNVVELLKNYHPSLWNKWSNRIVEMFLALTKEDNK